MIIDMTTPISNDNSNNNNNNRWVNGGGRPAGPLPPLASRQTQRSTAVHPVNVHLVNSTCEAIRRPLLPGQSVVFPKPYRGAVCTLDLPQKFCFFLH